MIGGAIAIALIVAAVLYFVRERARAAAGALAGAAERTQASAGGTSRPFGSKADAPGDAERRAQIEAELR